MEKKCSLLAVDWKTGKAPKNAADQKLKTLQLALYRLAYARFTGMPIEKIQVCFYFVGENKVPIPDFHATILHLLGLNHEKLTFYHNGINRRLTDVHGHVIRDIVDS